jgi:hypothetical protein
MDETHDHLFPFALTFNHVRQSGAAGGDNVIDYELYFSLFFPFSSSFFLSFFSFSFSSLFPFFSSWCPAPQEKLPHYEHEQS